MGARTIRYEDLLEKWKQDPEFRAEYEAQEPAFQIACRRIEKGLTQAELAKKVGTSQPSIARLESGEREPNISSLRAIAEALDCQLEVRLVPKEQTP